MRLYLEKVNQKFHPETYSVSSSNVEYIYKSIGFDVNVFVSSGYETFSITNEIPGLVGEQFIVNVDIEKLGGLSSGLNVYVYHDGVSQGNLSDGPVSFIKVDEELTFRFVEAGSMSLVMSEVSITKVGLVEVEMVNTEDIRLTKQVKDFMNMGDVKSDFSNNITIIYSKENIDNVGYFTNISAEDVLRLVNGVKAVITTDDGDKISDGVVTIKKVERLNENFYCRLFFSSFETSFFKRLSSTKLDLPHTYIGNTWQEKMDDIVRNTGELEVLEQDYCWGYVNNDFVYDEGRLNNQYPLNVGAFSYNISEAKGDSLSNSLSEKNDSVPWSHSLDDFPSGTQPLMRLKPIIKRIHENYGFTAHGKIFDDPKMYNLVLNPVKKDIKIDEENNIDDITLTNTFSWTSSQHHTGNVSHLTSSDLSYYSDGNKTLPWVSKVFDVVEYFWNTEYKTLYGDYLPFNMRGIEWNHNFLSKMKVKVNIKIEYDGVYNGYGRIIVADGQFSDTHMQMNPASFLMVEEILFTSDSSTGNEIYIEKEFTIEEFHAIKPVTDDMYVIRTNFVSDLTHSAGHDIVITTNITLSELNEDTGVEMNQPYYLDEQYNLDTTEQKTIKDFINKFNLIPQIDITTNEVTYYTFDEFYNADTTELKWNDIFSKDKIISYDYSQKNGKSIYNFENNSAANNYELDTHLTTYGVEYGKNSLKTPHYNQEEYTISNNLDNCYVDYSGNEIYGKYDKEDSEDRGGFPLMTNTQPLIKHQTIKLADGTSLSSKHRKYNSKKVSKTILGYARKTYGPCYSINQFHDCNQGVPISWKNHTKWYNTFYDTGSITVTEQNPIKLFPRFLAPLNEVSYNDNTNEKQATFPLFNTTNYDTLPNNFESENFNVYYKKEIDNFIVENTHTLQGYVDFDAYTFSNLTMREKIIVDNNRYIIKKISNFTPKKPTKVELLSYSYYNGWNEVFRTDGDIMMSSPNNNIGIATNKFQHINGGYNAIINFYTNTHTVGKTYRVTFSVRLGADGGTILRAYHGGQSSSYQDINQFCPGYTTTTITYEYVATEPNPSYPNGALNTTLYFEPVTSWVTWTIKGIIVEEKD